MMKKLNLFLALMVTLLLVSCGGNKEEQPGDLPVSVRGNVQKTAEILAAAGASSSSEIVFKLEDFTALTKYVKWVKSGKLETTNSKIVVEGIAADKKVELTDVKLSLKNNPKTALEMPSITANATFADLTQLNFLQSLLSEIVSKGSATLVLSYKSTNTITSPISLKVMLYAQFGF